MTSSTVYGGYFFPDIGKRAAVPHRLQRAVADPKELADALAQQSVTLGDRVFPGALFRAVDNRLGHQQAAVRRIVKDFVGVLVIPLANPVLGSGLGVEVEAGIDQIVTVGEKKLHEASPFAFR